MALVFYFFGRQRSNFDPGDIEKKQGSPDALDLLEDSCPFKWSPPTALRVHLGASSPDASAASGGGAGGARWAVAGRGLLVPEVSRGDAAVREALAAMHWTTTR